MRFLWVRCGHVALVSIFFLTYRYPVVATDLSDHEPAPSAPPHITAQVPTPQNLRILPDPDLTPPVISQVQVIFVDADTAVIH